MAIPSSRPIVASRPPSLTTAGRRRPIHRRRASTPRRYAPCSSAWPLPAGQGQVDLESLRARHRLRTDGAARPALGQQECGRSAGRHCPPAGKDRCRRLSARVLTMSSGLEWNESITSYGTLAYDETRLFWDWQPYRYVLSRPRIAKPGTRFNYHGGSTAVLAD